jgi:hypothetical protein
MTPQLPPLSALVRPEIHTGDPVTATTAPEIATGDLSARAERILTLVADHGERLLANTEDPLDVPDYVLRPPRPAG